MLTFIPKLIRIILYGVVGISAIFVGVNLRSFANKISDDIFSSNYARFLSWFFMLGGVGDIIAAFLLITSV
jgi:hypothetical protein